MKILLTTDGSRAAQTALEALASTFNLGEAEITLMHVVEMPWLHLGLEEDWFEEPGAAAAESGDDPELHVQLDREVRREADEITEAARDQLRGHPFSVTTVVEEGSPALQLLSQAEVGEYDLFIVGATGVADLKYVMLGSVSVKLAWNAPCSVAVVR